MPTKNHGKTSVFKLDTAAAGGVQDISAYLNSIKFSRDPDRPKAPTFGDLAERFPLLGLFANSFSLAGFYEQSALTKLHGKASRVLMDQYSLSSYLTTGKIGRKVDFPKNPTFGDVAQRYGIVGLMSSTFSFQGFADYTAAGFDAIMRAALATDPSAGTAIPIVSVGLNGFALGNMVEMLQAVPTKYDIDTGEEKPVEAMVDFASDDQVDLGVSLHDLVAETTAGVVNYTGVDETSISTSNGWVAHLHATAYSGWTSATIKIQDSADNGAWADLAGAAFTALTAVGKQRIVGASNAVVRRYVRAVVTFVGASGSLTFQVSFARRNFTYGSAGTHRHLAGLIGAYVNANLGPTLFEFAPIGTTSGNPKHTGSCRLSDYSIDFGEEKPTTFSASLLVDGQITDATY